MKNATGRNYKTSLDWLENYGLISKCYNLTLPAMPFESFKVSNVFKVYINDSGLYVAMLEDEVVDLIINNKLSIVKGAVYENIVADAFSKLNRNLYYYRKDSGLEIDFISQLKGEAVLVEVKAKSGYTKSAKEILQNKRKYYVDILIKLTSQNIVVNNNIFTYPYYSTGFLFNKEKFNWANWIIYVLIILTWGAYENWFNYCYRRRIWYFSWRF